MDAVRTEPVRSLASYVSRDTTCCQSADFSGMQDSAEEVGVVKLIVRDHVRELRHRRTAFLRDVRYEPNRSMAPDY